MRVPYTDSDGVKVEPFEMVDEFIERLTKADDRLSGNRFLFRGVPDATLPLLPSALRRPSPFSKEPTNENEQDREELMALRRFYDAAHFGGLTIPRWEKVKEYVRLGKPSERKDALEFIALAQHHGTPTTLLDWTLDPFVAAYFAASDMGGNFAESPEMVVWWFDPSVTKVTGYGMFQPWTEVTIPFDVNQNARAQRGSSSSM
jgi:hypothetical protein